MLLPSALAAVSLQTGVSPSTKIDSWKKADWYQEFEPDYLNLVYFCKSVDSLPSSVSPEQRSQLTSYLLEYVGTPVLKKLIEACHHKYLVPLLSDQHFEVSLPNFPAEVSKPLKALHQMTTAAAKTISTKSFLKNVEKTFAQLGMEKPLPQLDAEKHSTIFNTHRSSAMAQLIQPAKATASLAEPSTRLRMCLGILHAELNGGRMLLCGTKHLQTLLHLTKSEINSRTDPAFAATSNQLLVTMLDAAYSGLLAFIRAKQTKNQDSILAASISFDALLDTIVVLLKR